MTDAQSAVKADEYDQAMAIAASLSNDDEDLVGEMTARRLGVALEAR